MIFLIVLKLNKGPWLVTNNKDITRTTSSVYLCVYSNHTYISTYVFIYYTYYYGSLFVQILTT